MDKYKELEIINVLEKRLNLVIRKEVVRMTEFKPELLNDVYKEIYDELGEEATIKIYNLFKGQQITFPVKLNNSKKLQQLILKEYDGSNTRTLSMKYEYSEKSIRRIIKA